MIDQHASLSEKFLKKGFWLYLFTFLVAPIWYFIKILISWEVSVSDLGVLYWVISLITLLSAFSDLGIWESLKYFLPQYIQNKQYSHIKSILLYATIIQFLVGGILALTFFFWADFLANNYFKNPTSWEVMKVFSLFFLGINIFQIISQFFLAVQNTLYYKLAEFIRNIFMLLSVFLILFLDLGSVVNFWYIWIIWLYIWVFYSVWIFVQKYYYHFLHKESIVWSYKLFKEFFGYALLVFISAQASVILSQIDMQMIILMLWTLEAWYYTTYMSLIMIPFLLIWPVFLLLLPVFSEQYAKKNIPSIISMKIFFQKYFIALWIFFGLFLFVFSKEISFVLFWENFTKSWEILRYSSLFLLFNFLLQINFNILGAIGRIQSKLNITLIAIVFNMVLNIVLIWKIWVYGAALATWIWWLLIWILSEMSLWKQYFKIPNMIFISKNIFLLWWVAFISSYFVSPIIYSNSRIISLIFILWIGISWVLYFCIINLHECKLFISEVKKIKWKKS